MHVHTFKDADETALAAARFVADAARVAVQARGRFSAALSGGSTPWKMLRALAEEDLPWDAVHLFQVDERVAPAGDASRNLVHMERCLCALHESRPHVHAMPVEATALEQAPGCYGRTLASVCGEPPVLDLVHLGLGADGHTASLVPGDAVLEISDAAVALSAEYQGQKRMTLTYPTINRARAVLWLATGDAKTQMIARLRARDSSIPAGRVNQQRAVLFADEAAMGGG